MSDRLVALQESRHARAPVPVYVLCYDEADRFLDIQGLVRVLSAA